MSKKKHKKMNHTHANHRKVLTKKPTGFSYGKPGPDMLEFMMKYPEYFKESKLKDGKWVEIPCTETTFPITGNLFSVRIIQRGDDAFEAIADFALCLHDRYAVREFRFAGDDLMIFAVDAPVEDVTLIWETIIQIYNLGDFK